MTNNTGYINSSISPRRVFTKGSRTFSSAARMFPKKVRGDVIALYAFVRSVDDLIDQIPPNISEFYNWKDELKNARIAGSSVNIFINNFVRLEVDKKFDPAWTDAFMDSMEMDNSITRYPDYTALLEYIYGSAEVIGLCMARIMDLPDEFDQQARKLGRAFQLINMIRDINEDQKLSRTYLPVSEILQFGLNSLSLDEVNAKKDSFNNFMKFQLGRYRELIAEVTPTLVYIERQNKIALMTAIKLYDWTATEIEKDYSIVYRTVVKPSPVIVAKIMVQESLKS
jgi:15-cis-phytoene synthase